MKISDVKKRQKRVNSVTTTVKISGSCREWARKNGLSLGLIIEKACEEMGWVGK